MQLIADEKCFSQLDGGNKVYGNYPKTKNSTIKFNGENNILFCEENVTLSNCNITFAGNDSVVYLCQNKNDYSFNVTCNNGTVFYCGKDTYFNGKANIILSEQKNVFIGNRCLLSLDTWLRVADPHLIYSIETKQRLNYSKSIFIGDHVWIGQNVLVLKGTKVHSGSIIAGGSVIAGKEIASNCSWGGNPAKQIADGIFWDGACVHSWTKKQTDYYKTLDKDDFIYSYDENEYISFDEIDTALISKATAQDKYEFLANLSQNKNRFAYKSTSKKSLFGRKK